MKYAIVLFAAGLALAQVPECSLVPGFKQPAKAYSYTPDNLFEYMNGNAEGFIIYRLVKMNGVSCESSAGRVVLNVFEMADPEWAYGIFASNRDPRLPMEKIGVAGQVTPRQVIVVKDRYFVQVSADNEQPDTLRRFASAMESRIPGRSEPPAALGWFPPAGLQPNSIRLVPESVLGMRALRQGYVAQYAEGKAFLVPEETAESAAALMTKMRARFAESRPAKIADDGFEATDKYLGRLCFFRKGRYIGGFAGLKEGADAAAAAGRLAANVQ